MRYQIKVEVTLKLGHSDPEGEITEKSLNELNYQVNGVRVGKVFRFVLSAISREEAIRKVDEICRKLLANPVKDDYTYLIEEEK